MQYTKLGRSNVTISKICLGTMHFGTYTPEEEAYRIMDKALAGGLLTGQKQAVEGSRTQSVENEYGIRLSGDQFAAYSAFCREIGEPEQVVAIAWTLANPAVSSAIVGVRTVAHLEGLARAAELILEPSHLAKLDGIFNINRGRPLKSGEAPEAFAW